MAIYGTQPRVLMMRALAAGAAFSHQCSRVPAALPLQHLCTPSNPKFRSFRCLDSALENCTQNLSQDRANSCWWLDTTCYRCRLGATCCSRARGDCAGQLREMVESAKHARVSSVLLAVIGCESASYVKNEASHVCAPSETRTARPSLLARTLQYCS